MLVSVRTQNFLQLDNLVPVGEDPVLQVFVLLKVFTVFVIEVRGDFLCVVQMLVERILPLLRRKWVVLGIWVARWY